MVQASSQVRIDIQKDGSTIGSHELTTGNLIVGRSPEADLTLQDAKVSRRHCEIRLQAGKLSVQDLGSQNGTLLDGNRLNPQHAAPWFPGKPLQVGPFTLQVRQVAQARPAPDSPVQVSSATAAGVKWHVACGMGKPTDVIVTDKPITLGRDSGCDMELDDQRVSRRHVEVRQRDGRLWVTDLVGRGTTRLGGKLLEGTSPQPWRDGDLLQIGPFAIAHLKELTAAAPGRGAGRPAAPGSQGEMQAGLDNDLGSRMWTQWLRQLPWPIIIGAVGAVCVVVGLAVGAYRLFGPSSETPTPVANQPTPIAQPSPEILATAIPTGTPEPTAVQTPTRPSLVVEGTTFPTPTPWPTLECVPQTGGWLDLPFPYNEGFTRFGDAEQFRAVSQRSAAGGRINSFFDHQFPIYQNEDSQVSSSLVLFDGSASSDKWSFPNQPGDYYSGHPGIDYSPQDIWGETPTPLLAPADGLFVGAGIDSYGNYFVKLLHEREAGSYQTWYLHLKADEHFQRMRDLPANTPIRAGDRIGTMGTTGKSTGIHLHFEVRFDCNGDGYFELREAVDPYGFMASPEIPVDPLTSLGTCSADQYKYLWKYPVNPDLAGEDCDLANFWQLDPAPFDGFVSIATFFFSTRDPNIPTPVRIWLKSADVGKMSLSEGVFVYRYDLAENNWVVVPLDADLDFDDERQRFFVRMALNLPGRYTVMGTPKEDIIPPVTEIIVSDIQPGTATTPGSAVIELVGLDSDGRIVPETRYSLDCGETWQVYGRRAFTATTRELKACGIDESHEGDEWGLEADEYLILASSRDLNNNWEQPPSLMRFRLSPNQ